MPGFRIYLYSRIVQAAEKWCRVSFSKY